MCMNFLETLAAEWYEYTGYFVRTNVRARKRKQGGFEHELDVLAYDPRESTVVHIETSGDTASMKEREQRFRNKKFILSLDDYQEILNTEIAGVEKVAIVGYSKKTRNPIDWGEIEVILIPTFIKLITDTLRTKDVMTEGVPETYPLLRAIQFTVHLGQ